MHLILTGATGLIGSAVLDAMVKTPELTKISVLSRRPVQMAQDLKDPRVQVIIHKDFETYDAELLDKIKDANGCVWALGISQTKVGKEEYVRITKTLPLAAAKAFQTLPASKSEPFRFIYVSGAGSTVTPGRFTPIFARTKGETELALADLANSNPLFYAASVRPCLIDDSEHPAIKPYVPRRGGTALGALEAAAHLAVKAGFYRSTLWSPTFPLGKFLTDMAVGRWEDEKLKGNGVEWVRGFPIIENLGWRRVAGLDGK